MTLNGTRFGTIEFGEEDTLVLKEGLIGFPELQRFVVLAAKDESPFRWLQCLEEPALAFLVTDPGHFLPDYAPEMPEAVARDLALTPETPRLVFTTVSIPPGRPRDMTLNLAGPVLINASTRVGRQIVLEEEAYTTRYRVFEQADRTDPRVAA